MAHADIVSLLNTFPTIDVNLSMSNGATPLIISAYLGNASCIEQLLKHAALDTTLLFDEHTAFHWCQPDSRAEAWKFLEVQINVKGRVVAAQLLADAGAK